MWSYMSTRGQLFQRASTIQLSLVVLYKADISIILLNVTCSRHDIALTPANYKCLGSSLDTNWCLHTEMALYA